MSAFDARPSFTAELDPGALMDGDLFTAFAAGELPVARLVHVARVADGHDLALPRPSIATSARTVPRWPSCSRCATVALTGIGDRGAGVGQ